MINSGFYLSALFCSLLFLTARPVSAQEPKMFLKATASKQGSITGSASDDISFKSLIRLTNVSFNEAAPANADTYRDKGATKHEILKVSKKVDNLSPQFLMAFSNREAFSEVIIEFVQPNSIGKPVAFMVIELGGNVSISDFKQNGDSETISFSYTRMTVTEHSLKP
jgi:type VI secretion system Hcp family effector